MKTSFFTLTLLCLGNGLSAQTPATITARDIYDFEVGDEFHYSVKETRYSPGYDNRVRKLVLAKAYNADSTQVTYTIEQLKNINNCEWELDTIQEVYSNLNHVFDSVYVDEQAFYTSAFYQDCGVISLENPSIQLVDTAFVQRTRIQMICGYGDWEKKHWAVGLGEVHIRQINSAHCCSINMSLIYYKKGNEEWGTPDSTLVTHQWIAPPILTRREVFDFEVGDLFQRFYSYGYGIEHAGYRQYEVICKTVNDSESVSYSFEVVDSPLSAQPVRRYTEYITYDRLSEPCVSDICWTRYHPWRGTCSDVKYMNEKQEANGGYSSSWEIRRYYIQGCGEGEVSNTFSYYGGSRVVDTLVWYCKKAENTSCGLKILSPQKPVPIEEVEEVRVHYHYGMQQLTIYLPSSLVEPKLVIVDMSGRIVYRGVLPSEISPVSLDNFRLEKGVYAALVIDRKGNKARFKLVAEQ